MLYSIRLDFLKGLELTQVLQSFLMSTKMIVD